MEAPDGAGAGADGAPALTAAPDGADAGRPGRWRARYERSAARDLVAGLGRVQFGERIIVFGASLLLSVLPLIILLGALASQRVDDDIAARLGLDRQGTAVLERLFRHPTTVFNLGILVGLLLALAGTVAVARSVQVMYEKAFDRTPSIGWRNLVRCLVWVAAVGGLLVFDSAVGRPVRDDTGPVVLGLLDVAVLGLFFWWSVHFLLVGRVRWREAAPAGLATAVFWVGLGVFASLYFAATVTADSHTYGTIGVVFTLVTWFIAMGAVLTLGAVVGAVAWRRRHPAPPGAGTAGGSDPR